MKIIYAANVRFPSERAHAVQIAHMCQAFAKCGHATALYVNKRSTNSLEEVGQEFGFTPLFEISRVRPKRIFIWFKPSFVISECWFVFHMWLSLRHQTYDVIYTRSEWIAWALTFLIDPTKVVWESHEAKYNFAAKKIFSAGVKTVVISKGIQDFYAEQGEKSSQLLVADDAIDESFFTQKTTKKDARDTLRLPEREFIVMYIGGLAKWKGVDTLFKSISVSTGVKCVVIGGTEVEISELQAKYPDINFLGNRPYRDLAINQQAADILVIPNTAMIPLSASYTSPLKLFAHMSSGIPVLMSDIKSLTHVVPPDQVTTFEPDNHEDLAKKILLIKDQYEAKKIMAESLKKTAAKYTWESRAKKIARFIFSKV